jgi:ABC-type transport system involved in multi-copper enzyme maturation permease subunit
MTNRMTRSIMWKEYRHLRALWVTLAVATIVAQLPAFAAWWVGLGSLFSSPFDALLGISAAMPVFYALGCGAMLFAAEYEGRTRDYLCALPASASAVVLGKFGVALLSIVLIYIVAWGFAAMLSGGALLDSPDQPAVMILSAITALEVFAWGTFFSLLVRRVLWATVLAAVAALAVGYFAVSPLVWASAVGKIDPFFVTLPVRLSVVLTILACDLWLGLRWLRFERAGMSHYEYFRLGGQPVARRRYSARAGDDVVALGMLVWHAWRQSWALLAVILLADVFFVVAGTALVHGTPYWGASGLGANAFFATQLWFVPLTAGLLGACIFAADQRQSRYQFFAQQGIDPGTVWLSRQLVGGGFLLGWGVLAVTWLVLTMALADQLAVWTPLVILGLSLLCYCAGQFCSLVIRSPIVAVFCALLAGWLLIIWAVWMVEFGVPLWFSVLPIPFILVWASWRRASDWIEDKTTWRARSKLALSVTIPALILLAGVVWHHFSGAS